MGSMSPGPTARVAKWLGLQVAAKAVSLALGTPIVAGAAMGLLAYVQGLPLAHGFLAVILAAAGVSTLLNQARTFLLTYSAANKIVTGTAEVLYAKNPQGVEGYGVGIRLRNLADIPLAFEIRKASAHLADRVAKTFISSGRTGVIEAGGMTTYRIGLIEMAALKSQVVSGELEISIAYGRPGKLSHTFEEKLVLSVGTKSNGDVASLSTYMVS